MNKVIRKALAGVAALGIAASGLALSAATAYAADSGPTTGSITINATSNNLEHTFAGWHLASLTNITKNADQKINGFLIDTDDSMVDAIVNAMTEPQKTAYQADANYYSTDNTVANPMGYLVDQVFKTNGTAIDESQRADWAGSTSTLRAFATSLQAELAKENAPKATATLKTGENKDLTRGLWFLEDTTDSDDVAQKETNSIPIITPTTFDGADSWGTIDLKNTVPTIDKKLVDGNKKDGYTDNKQPDYAVGDTVSYELTSTIPTFTGYDIDPTLAEGSTTARVFKITDTASKALTVEEGTVIESVKLTKGDQAVELTNGSDYTVSVAPYAGDEAAYAGGHVTTIDLGKYVNQAAGSKSAADGILEGATVTVIVKTTLNKSALLSTPGHLQKNPNKVDLTYSNKPNEVKDAHKVPGPEVPVYAYKFGILKTDKAGNPIQATDTLTGAKFIIKAVSGTTNHDGKYLGTYGENGWSYADDESTAGVFTTDKDGKIAVEGLDAGTYEVKEIAPPTGYTAVGLPTFRFTITPTVDPTNANGHKTITAEELKITQTSAYVKINDSDGSQLDVWNAKNITELPKTGGAGLVMILAAGAMFIAAGGLFALRARRKA